MTCKTSEMSTTSQRFSETQMRRQSETLRLDSNPIVSLDNEGRLIDFEATRFRTHSLLFQVSLHPLVSDLSAELGLSPVSLDALKQASPTRLQRDTYCVYDFLELRFKDQKGFTTAKWSPYSVFSKSEKVFSLHASYGAKGARLSGITMLREGSSEFTKCETIKAAAKVGRSFLRTYVLGRP